MPQARIACLESRKADFSLRLAPPPMKKALIPSLIAFVCCIPNAHADLALAMSKNCMSCHAVERRILGPSFKDVAARYKDDKTASDKLAAKIMKGGSGVWGAVPMPANPQVNEAEAKQLVQWILTVK